MITLKDASFVSMILLHLSRPSEIALLCTGSCRLVVDSALVSSITHRTTAAVSRKPMYLSLSASLGGLCQRQNGCV